VTFSAFVVNNSQMNIAERSSLTFSGLDSTFGRFVVDDNSYLNLRLSTHWSTTVVDSAFRAPNGPFALSSVVVVGDGALTLSGVNTAASNINFYQNAGTSLVGDGTLLVRGTMYWEGGKWDGSGSVVTSSAGVLRILGGDHVVRGDWTL